MRDRTRWILSVSGGVLAALPWWGLPVTLLLICFVPLLFVEDDIQTSEEPVLSLLPFSFIFFFSWNLTVCWWMARIHLLGGMSVIILNALLMSLVFLLYSRIKRSTGGGVVVFVILWIGFEFLHYRGDLSWPWLSLGNGLAGNIRLIQWYEFTGTTGGSLWILLVNAMLFTVIKSFSRKGRAGVNYLVAALLILLIVLPPAVSFTIFNHKFAAAIRIDGITRMIFAYGYLSGQAVCCAGRGENKFFDLKFEHGLQQVQGVGHVVKVVFSGGCN